jgi:starvation-inducible DNA-binding protein
MKANLAIPETHLQAVAEQLNILLADEIVLAMNTRNYHWNVEGANHQELHRLYEVQYKELDEMTDQIAERIRIIGHYAEARLIDYLKLTNLIEPPYTNLQNDQLKNLLASHETIIHSLRRSVTLFANQHKDIGSSDFVTQLLEKHETMAWKVRSYLG